MTEVDEQLKKLYPQNHRLCSHPDHQGQRWLWIGEFGLQRRKVGGETRVYLRSYCDACNRVTKREWHRKKARERPPRQPKPKDTRTYLEILNHNYPLNKKLCSYKGHVGPRWIWIGDFFGSLKLEDGNPRNLQGYCKCCQREVKRISGGHLPRRAHRVNPERPMTGAEKNKRSAENRKKDAERTRLYREYHRIYYHTKLGGNGSNRKVNLGSSKLPAAPLLEYLEENRLWDRDRRKGKVNPMPDNIARRLREGEKSGILDLSSIDNVLHFLNRHHLLPILYPDD